VGQSGHEISSRVRVEHLAGWEHSRSVFCQDLTLRLKTMHRSRKSTRFRVPAECGVLKLPSSLDMFAVRMPCNLTCAKRGCNHRFRRDEARRPAEISPRFPRQFLARRLRTLVHKHWGRSPWLTFPPSEPPAVTSRNSGSVSFVRWSPSHNPRDEGQQPLHRKRVYPRGRPNMSCSFSKCNAYRPETCLAQATPDRLVCPAWSGEQISAFSLPLTRTAWPFLR